MRRTLTIIGVLLCHSSGSYGAEDRSPSGQPGPAKPVAAPMAVDMGLLPPQPPQPLAPCPTQRVAIEKRRLLNEKLAERDRLNREIEALREEASAQRAIMIRLEVVSISHDDLKTAGLVYDWVTPYGVIHATGEDIVTGAVQVGPEQLLQFAQSVKKNKLAKTLSNPCVMTVSGRPASVHVGGQFPLPVDGKPNAVDFKKFGMMFDLVPEDLGDNRVHLAFRHELSDANEKHSIVIKDLLVPSLRTSVIETSIEAVYGETQVLMGPTTRREVTSGWPMAKAKTEDVTTLVLITAEPADAVDPQVRPASAETPTLGAEPR